MTVLSIHRWHRLTLGWGLYDEQKRLRAHAWKGHGGQWFGALPGQSDVNGPWSTDSEAKAYLEHLI
jgi:hypothetical protein